MKQIIKSMLIVLNLAAVIPSLATNSFAQSKFVEQHINAADVVVTDLRLEAKNINQTLAEVAYKYNVPISLEAAIDEDFLKSKRVTVQVTKGKIVDVLNSIVKQKPAYTWEVTETRIRVFPKSDFRDPLLQTLLELRIARFVLPKRAAKLTFRQILSGRPELKSLLASYGVSSSVEAFSPYDIASFGDDFSLDVENATVRSILDSIITDSPIKYWFINRNGVNRQDLVINF
ncbi:MAG TPA: hypothetical protein VFX63_14435 [Pyrinomonadaceae bacterium]|nr:hypothetical protein [Pyrinomonadaceae bacterium]